MAAPQEILQLVKRFDDNVEAYCSSAYNEMQVRREFIDPFFKCLAWDIDNTQGFAEAYKDVIHEDVNGGIEIKGSRIQLANWVAPSSHRRRHAAIRADELHLLPGK